jgi:alkylation response protein AidB-like acyl-CoA dehydrogenase
MAMTQTVIRKGVDADELLRRVGDLAPLIRKHAPEAERNRCLSAAVVDAMRDAGLYTMARPKAYGGLELDPVSSFRVVEEVARYDSAAGWNLNLSTAVDYFPAWLPDDGAEEILTTQRLVLGASFNPNPGGAIAVDGGYRVNGQWRFVSGCQQAAWFLLLCPLMDGDKPALDEQANPKMLFVFLPAAQVTIMDTWYTLGLRGTGSHNIEITDQFVPDRRAAALAPLEQPGSAFTGPLYRLTIWPPIALLAPPALGIARASVDDFVALARGKTPSFTGTTLADRQVVQRQVAQADAHVRAGRAFLHQAFGDAWAAAVRGDTIELDRKLVMQLATTHAVASAAAAVDLVHAAAGTSAIRDEQPFQQHFRDIHTLTQHAFSSAQRFESVGALMLGTETDWGFFPF